MPIADATRFQAEGAFINWAAVARRLESLDFYKEAVAKNPSTLQLRWMIDRKLGLPTEPFIVWRRRKGSIQAHPVPFENLPFIGGTRIVSFGSPVSRIEVDVQGGAGMLLAFAGAPTLFNTVTFAAAPGGNATMTLAASSIDGLVVSAGVVVSAVRAVPVETFSKDSGWERLEIVGLPVTKADWGGVAQVAADQGMVNALTDPQTAARQRLERGAPPVGWAAAIAAGFPAPVWTQPDFGQLIKDVNADLLDVFQPIAAGSPPKDHWKKTAPVVLPPPVNSSGKKMSGPDRTTDVSPWNVALIGAGSDPHMALTLGFGTAYPGVETKVGATALFFDYMVTARWAPDGRSAPLELAAIVPAPAAALPPPPPANLGAEFLGHLQPLQRDQNWRCSVRVQWDRPFQIPIFLPRTYAFASTGITPAQPVKGLMTQRHAGGFAPNVLNYAQVKDDPEPNRVSAVDRELPIPANPGNRTMKYAVAHQDLYGQWSAWKNVNRQVEQPAVDQVRIVSAEFQVAVPANGAVCPASLVVEFLWDWSVRSPFQIRLGGRLYSAAHRGDPPPNTNLPTGLPRSLGGAEGFAVVQFAGAVPSMAGATIIGLNPAGDKAVPFGSQQSDEGRRYRLTIPGFQLNFASTGHIGLALWAQGVEAIAPQRTGDWSKQPSVISASDPRPPVIPPDIVTLASLPDAAGECHVRLSWGASAGAAGYFVYESTETKILQANGLHEPTPDQTLSQRLGIIKNAFDANPSRREFTRRNAKLITATSVDLTLPRGSQAIHVFIMLGVSAGQVEAKWPTGANASDQWQAFAAPRLAPPSAPTLEVRPVANGANILVQTRKGPRVKRIDLHRVRVDDAAKELDTMGPPVLTISPATPAWNVATTNDALGLHIEQAIGTDAPSGSWKRVWYRAVAWSEKDDLRGLLPDRSPASNAAWTVVPPATPPPLSGLAVDWPSGGALGDAIIRWTSAAPVRKTPLGAHTITVQAKVTGNAPATLINVLDKPLSSLATAAPGAGSGVWRSGGGPPAPVEYSALIRRTDVNHRVQVMVRITDPLGRTSEKFVTVEPGPVLPPPNLGGFSIVKSLNPPGVQLNFTSSSPIKEPAAGDYKLRVTVVRPKPPNQFVPPPPIIVEMGLDDVPPDEPGPIPPGADPVRVRRNKGPVNPASYYVFSRVAVSKFIVRLTSPDGRSVEHTEQVV